MNVDGADASLTMMMRRRVMMRRVMMRRVMMRKVMMRMVTFVATFLDHSGPNPLPPLRLLGHGGD